MSKIEENVIDKIRLRAAAGKSKYGTTMERKDLFFKEWAQHLQEELLDAAVYLERLMQQDHWVDSAVRQPSLEPYAGFGVAESGKVLVKTAKGDFIVATMVENGLSRYWDYGQDVLPLEGTQWKPLS